MNPAESVALVTGANKGLGKEISRQLAAQGVFVWMGARDRERGERAARELKGQGLKVQYIALDVTDQNSIDQAANQVEEQFGRLDVAKRSQGRQTGEHGHSERKSKG